MTRAEARRYIEQTFQREVLGILGGKPKALNVASMAQFEAAVFDSWSTHPNAGQDQSVTGKGGLVRLWDDLAARGAKVFPVSRLKPFHPHQNRPAAPQPVTVAQLIAKAS